jgi:hypothetical protein
MTTYAQQRDARFWQGELPKFKKGTPVRLARTKNWRGYEAKVRRVLKPTAMVEVEFTNGSRYKCFAEHLMILTPFISYDQLPF